MNARPILCVGALIADLMMQLPELPRSAGKHLPKGARLVVAGMATSAATAVARLGHPVSLWASIGDDAVGDILAGALAAEGIGSDLVRRVPGAMSAMSAIFIDDRGEKIVVPWYAPELLGAPDRLPDFGSFGAVLVDVRWPKAAAIALDGARAVSIPAVLDLDVGAREVLADLAPRASHIVASLDGARVLLGECQLEEAVAKLRSLTGAMVVVTDGERGASWHVPGGPIRHQAAFAVAAVDTNAAGDIFHGAFMAALAEEMDLAQAVRFSSAAAAIKCTRFGGRDGAPTRGEVDAFLEQRRLAAH
ncbi:MAG: sugar kinase [Rhizobiaceae bacterium]|nr:sugar kinase [Rhizobiaceae bacterium]